MKKERNFSQTEASGVGISETARMFSLWKNHFRVSKETFDF